MIDTPWPFPNLQQEHVKREAMEDDSGIQSGSSDTHSPPYGDNVAREKYQESQPPFYGLYHPYAMGQYGQYHPPTAVQHPIKIEQQEVVEARRPLSASPNQEQNHLRNLEQLSLEKTGMTTSSANLTVSHSDGNSDVEMDDDDEQSWKMPKMNSHGKVKYHKCKQCSFISDTKEKLWNHIIEHIPEEKRLSCPKCPFITEYKHHLEYHLRLHDGSKPFRCRKCDYQCVNKSMLNSHMKSHSNVYRYSCRDCTYATKYCHSLKMHLRRYNHVPNVVLDENGKPSPEIVIDVYGTRRGPKVKTAKSEESAVQQEVMPPLALPPFPVFPGFMQLQQVQLIQQLLQHRQAAVALAQNSDEPEEEPNPNDALDLSSKPSCSFEPSTPKSRRKGPPYRVDPAASTQSEDDEEDLEDDVESTTMFSNVEAVVQSDEAKAETTTPPPDGNNNKSVDNNRCQYCNISFGDAVLHTMHMGYHGYNNPFICNMCGVQCEDKISFFVHIARVSH